MSRKKKCVNTFAAYQSAKMERREGLIKIYLATLRKSRVEVKYVTDLAKMVAVHIGQVEQGECNTSTLLRNKRYKALLLSYMAERITQGSKQIDATAINHSASQTLVIQASLEASNLKRETQRLKAYIIELEGRLENTAAKIPALPSNSPAIDHCEESELKYKYVRTCQAIGLILEHWKDFMGVDMENNQIVDLSSRRLDPHRLIVDSNIAAPFFEWLKKAG